MDEHTDPLLSFFPEASSSSSQRTVLYSALSLSPTCTQEEIRKSYRRQALLFHPDKHQTKSPAEKEELSRKFQRVGFAYAILSDETKRKRYDSTGKTDERFADLADGEGGWEKYFESLFDRVDRKVLDDHKEKYQGSEEETSDLISAYKSSSGSLPSILSRIPHSNTSDEPRFIEKINHLISTRELDPTPKWRTSSTDAKARMRRIKAEAKGAKEAEESARELGVWDEFYGSGKKGKRVNDDIATQGKGKENENDAGEGGEAGEGEGTLQALILKRQRDRQGGLSKLEEKYKKIEEDERERKRAKKGKGNKGKRQEEQEQEDGPPDISDADFEALQAKMFGNKTKANKGKA